MSTAQVNLIKLEFRYYTHKLFQKGLRLALTLTLTKFHTLYAVQRYTKMVIFLFKVSLLRDPSPLSEQMIVSCVKSLCSVQVIK